MKFVYSGIDTVFNIEETYVNELVIENKRLFREVVEDLSAQVSGFSGKALLSIDNVSVDMQKHIEVITCFVPFEMNRKTLISKMLQKFEEKAVDSEHFFHTSEIMMLIETYLDNITEDSDCELSYSKLNISSIIKAAGIEIDEYGKSNLERMYDYFELVRSFEGDKVFFLVNMRAFYSDDDMREFIRTAIGHRIKIFLLESEIHGKLENIVRTTIDEDLCEF